jgi:hypothetical protein
VSSRLPVLRFVLLTLHWLVAQRDRVFVILIHHQSPETDGGNSLRGNISAGSQFAEV